MAWAWVNLVEPRGRYTSAGKIHVFDVEGEQCGISFIAQIECDLDLIVINVCRNQECIDQGFAVVFVVNVAVFEKGQRGDNVIP